MIEKVYQNEDVQVMVIPDIESVNWGRGVGYGTIEHQPPADIGFISATAIRNAISEEDDSWKQNVDDSIHDLVVKYLKERGE